MTPACHARGSRPSRRSPPAGVGRGTASRVINGSPQVSDRAGERVMEAVDELGYVPNPAARALVTRRTDTVALVIASPRSGSSASRSSPASSAASARSSATPSASWCWRWPRPASGRAALERYLTRQHVDGVLLLSLHDEDTLPQPDPGARPARSCSAAGRRPERGCGYRRRRQPRRGPAGRDPPASQRGRRHVATIAGPPDMVAGRDRLDGLPRRPRGRPAVSVDDRSSGTATSARTAARPAMATLLDRRPDIDAVFAPTT